MSRPAAEELLLTGRGRRLIAGALVLATAALFAIGLLAVPRERTALPPIARFALTTALPRWHTTEPVNEIVYGSRGFDTFGETFLLLAVVGLLRMRHDWSPDEPQSDSDQPAEEYRR